MADSLEYILGIEEIAAMMGVDTITPSGRAVIEQLRGSAEASVKSMIGYDPLRKQHIEFMPDNWRRGEIDPLLNDVSVYASSFAFVALGRRGNDVLQLRHLPVVLDSTLEVREHLGALGGQAPDAFPSSSLLTRGSDYYLDVSESIAGNLVSLSGHLRRNGVWPSEPRTIKVTYNGGWARADLDDGGYAHDIKTAALETVQKAILQARFLKKGMPLTSESFDGEYSVSYDSQSVGLIAGMSISVPPSAQRKLARFMHYGRLFL